MRSELNNLLLQETVAEPRDKWKMHLQEMEQTVTPLQTCAVVRTVDET
jgi:hypothetical protein